jgi:hypothetical protein
MDASAFGRGHSTAEIMQVLNLKYHIQDLRFSEAWL